MKAEPVPTPYPTIADPLSALFLSWTLEHPCALCPLGPAWGQVAGRGGPQVS